MINIINIIYICISFHIADQDVPVTKKRKYILLYHATLMHFLLFYEYFTNIASATSVGDRNPVRGGRTQLL